MTDIDETIIDQMRTTADEQIKEKQKVMDYEIREFPISVIVSKFTGNQDGIKVEPELFIPEYQREFVWSKKQQSRFIESIMINLPIPYLFVADISEEENEEFAGRLEIVDGAQRTQTLVAFLHDELKLQDLEKLDTLNNFYFSDLSNPRKLRFRRKTIRMIELTEQADEESRRDLFERINTGGTKLTDQEQRRGSTDGAFNKIIERSSSFEQFRTLCPVSEVRRKRNEYGELALRFYAYLENYQNFRNQVNSFLTDYLTDKNQEESEDNFDELYNEFTRMLDFVGLNFPNHFRKNERNKSVPRIRYEAIAVGTALALRITTELKVDDIDQWLESDDFNKLTKSDASNSKPRLINRLHFVRDKLLGREVEYYRR
jgi:uncharacterized protein with ParB-like and HNH nuclease domain